MRAILPSIKGKAGKFDFTELAELGRNGTLASALSVKLGWYSLSVKGLALLIFAGAFLGFAVKVPLIRELSVKVADLPSDLGTTDDTVTAPPLTL